MIKFLRWAYRKIHGIPKKENGVWYNRSLHMSAEKFPVVRDKEGRYIHCEVGLQVLMGYTSTGDEIYYKVIRMKRSPGGDWLMDSDNIDCDLEFDHIKFKREPTLKEINEKKAADMADFLNYTSQARDKFVIKVNEQEWNTELRMEAENILIAYDQLRDQLEEMAKEKFNKK